MVLIVAIALDQPILNFNIKVKRKRCTVYCTVPSNFNSIAFLDSVLGKFFTRENNI